MSLLCYFKASGDTAKLPNSHGPLSTKVPSSAIESANAEVKRVIETGERGADRRKRGCYDKFSPELKLQIRRRAAENRVAATMRFYMYAKKFVLKESSIRKAYTREIPSKKGDITRLKCLPEKKRGRPYLLGEEVDQQVRA